MFDLFSGTHRQVPRRDTIPLYLSIAAHLLVIGVIGVPLLYVATELPEVPEILAYVAAAPPPPPPAAAPRPAKAVSKPVAESPRSAPVEPAKEILPERTNVEFGGGENLPGGVEGGVPGGIPRGVVGGLIPEVLLPPHLRPRQ